MKKNYNLLITSVLIFSIILSFSIISSAQVTNIKDYDKHKKEFWIKYQAWKDATYTNGYKNIPKPIDINNLFYIDENNSFQFKQNRPDYFQSTVFNPPTQPDAVTGYTFSMPSGTYTTITGQPGEVVQVSSPPVDDNGYAALPIGFTFYYSGTAYTTFGVASNGIMILGSGSVPTTYYSLPINQTTNNLIAPMGADLYSSSATLRMSYLLTGSAPNRVLTYQWQNFGFYNAGVQDGNFSMQIKLFEGTNNIQFIYGTCTATGTYTPQAGLRGSSTSDVNTRTTTTNWSATTAGTSTSTCTYGPGCVPAANLIFQWEAPPIAPQYYNYNTSGSANSFPFNVSTGKAVQWLIGPGEFTGAPGGMAITYLWFYMAGAGTQTYNNYLTIKLDQTTATSLPSGVIYTSGTLTTVYQAAPTLTHAANSWTGIQLTAPYPYDPTKSLIIDVSQCGYSGTGATINQTSLSGIRRTYINGTTGCVFTYSGQDATVGHIGITLQPAGPCTDPPVPGTVTSTANPVCPGQNFTLGLSGGTSGTGQTYQWQSSPDNSTWTNIPGAINSTHTTSQTSATYYRCAVTCGTTVNSGSLLVNMVSTLNGTYTINNTLPTGGTNFNNFTDAINALNACGGPSGPVTFNVIAGQTFTEKPPVITATGTSANPIIFQKSGAGANPRIQSAVAGSGTLGNAGNNVFNDAFFTLVGSDYVTINGIDMLEQYTGATQTLRMEYGVLMVRKTATDGCKNINIQNCVIELYYQNTYSQCIATINYNVNNATINPTALSGIHENIYIDGCTLTNTHVGVLIYGYSSPTYYENNIRIGTNAPNLIKNSSYSTTSYGVYMIYANNVVVANNTFISGQMAKYGAVNMNTTTLYGIMLSTGTNSNADIYNNIVRDSSTISTGMTTTQMAGIYCAMGSSGTNNTINVYNNTVSCVYSTATTGALYSIYMITSPLYMNVYGNQVVYNQIGSATTAGTGLWYGIYSASGTSTAGSQYQFYNNNISNNSRQQSALSGGTTHAMYIPGVGLTLNVYGNTINNNSWPGTGIRSGIYTTSTTPLVANIYNNTISNNTCPLVGASASSGSFYGIYNTYSSGSNGVCNVYSNNIYNNSSTGATTFYGIYGYTGATTGNRANIYQNSVYNLNATGTSGGTIYGIYSGYGNTYIYRNLIRDLRTSTAAVYGIYTSSSSNNYIYNNFIQELSATSSSYSPGVTGIYVSNSSGYNNYLYYNSIYLNSSTTLTYLYSAGVYASTTPNLEMKNNIIVNNSSAGTTSSGYACAYWRNSTNLTTYSAASTANCLSVWSGPFAYRRIFFDGTNTDQTISTYKTRVYPREQQSFTENPPFINIATAPYDLHLNTGTATLCNNYGIPVTSPVNITDDYDGNTRSTTQPDIGADEFAGISAADIIPPYITYPLLTNGGTGGKYFPNVTITDATSGVNTTPGTKPRCYYKKSTNSNTFIDNTSATDGWKYVEANGTTSPFDFNIDYTKIFGGSVTTGDIIQYFVIAQDLAGTPNVGHNQVVFSSAPASVNLYGTGITTSGTINQYTIVQTWSGIINIGPSYTYTSLTNAGGIFAAINANPTLSGNLTIVIKENLTAETGANALNQWAEDGIGGYTVTITCDPGTNRTVSGSYAGGLIRLNGADRVIFDGQALPAGVPGGYLTFQNTSTSASTATIMLMSLGTGLGCRQVQIKNCNIKCGTNTTTTYGVHLGSTSVGGSGYDHDSCTIQNNKIDNAYYGIWSYSATNISNGGFDNLLITQNRCGNDTVANSISYYGIYMYYNVNPTISSNTVDHLGTSTNYGLYLAYNVNPLITQNTIRDLNNTSTIYGIYSSSNTNPSVTQNNFYNLTSSSSMYIIYMTSPATSYNISQNNIYNNTSTGTGSMYGMYLTSCPNGTVSQNNIYNINTYGTFYGMYFTGVTGSNIFSNNIYNVTATYGAYYPYGIYVTGATTTSNFYKNRINTIRYNGASFYMTPRAIYLASSTIPANLSFYNNIIYDIWGYGYTPITSGGLAAIYIASGGGYNFYFNSVNLYGNMSSSSTQVCADVYVAASVTGLNFRDNSFTNTIVNSTPGSKSYSFYSDAPASSYTTINYNDYYAGGTQGVLGYIGALDRTTINDWRTGTGQDLNSISADPLYNAPDNLQPIPGSPLYHAGIPAGGILDDYLGAPRHGTTPTIGAYEEANDAAGPIIAYTPLNNITSTANRSFTNVSITDASGVNTTSGTRPRCYYKKQSNANTWVDNTAFTNGWKWVEANGTSSPFDFTIDYSKLYPTGSVTTGDTIQYFVIAQDLWTTPNVSINSGTPATPPSSVQLNASHFPMTGTINKYLISQALSGIINIGPAQIYQSLTNAGGFFEAINNSVVVGNITAYITADTLNETGLNGLNQWAEEGTGGYTITIRPSSASQKYILGNVAQGLIRFNGCDRVTIDGNYSGPGDQPEHNRDPKGNLLGNYLLFRNSNGFNPTFTFINDARRNTITNCIIESNNQTSYGSANGGTIYFGGTTGTDGNDSNEISYCDIRDNSDGSGTPICAITSLGSTGTTAQFNSQNRILYNNIFNVWNSNATQVYVYIPAGNTEWTFTGNSWYQTVARTGATTAMAPFGLILATTGDNFTFTNNYFGGTAPQCGGPPMYYDGGAGLFAFRFFQTGNVNPTSIQGNVIKNIDFTLTSTSATPFFFRGLDCNGNVAGNYNIGNIQGNIIGGSSASDTTGQIILRYNGTAATGANPMAINVGFTYTSGILCNVQNNIIGSIVFTGTGTGTINFWAIGLNSTVNTTTTCSNNIIGSSVANSIRNESSTLNLNLTGIYSLVAAPAANITMNNNTIQNFSNASLGAAGLTRGIYHTGTAPPIITNNTIRYLDAASAPNTNNIYGIYDYSTASGHQVSGNLIYSLYSTSTSAINYAGTVGIITGTSGTGTMTQNRIYDLRNQSAHSSSDIDGIVPQGGTWVCSNNQITLTNGETTMDAFPYLNNNNTESILFSRQMLNNTMLLNNNTGRNSTNTFAINNSESIQQRADEVSGSTLSAETQRMINEQENQIKQTKKEALDKFNSGRNTSQTSNNFMIQNSDNAVENSNPVSRTHKEGGYTPDYTNDIILLGILDANQTGSWSYYYNSVYIGGSILSGIQSSAAYVRVYTGTTTLRNNLFYNGRTGGTSNFAISNEASPPSTGWSSTASNYNVLIGSNLAKIGEWGIGINRTIDEWRTSSGGDKQSWSTRSDSVTATNLFTSIATGNLNIQSGNPEAWIVSGKGIAISGITTDYEGTPRVDAISSGVTDIGADEFTINPLFNPPPAAVEIGTIGSGNTTTYRLWGRNILSIDWLPGGTSYPSTMTVKYYSGILPPNPTLGSNYSYSYWDVVPTGSLTGAEYTITINFGDNETYTILTPSSNTRLAKYNGSTWTGYIDLGPYRQSTELNWANLWAKVREIPDFSAFALTDATAALPVIISEFSATVKRNNVNLMWVTEKEINNQKFEIQRAKIDENGNDFLSWQSVGTVPAAGTSYERKVYNYTDRVNVGKYNYRLKQYDFNGNFEYFDLNNPKDVIVGKPMNSDMSQNYPNPSNPKSKIDYQIPFKGKVSIKLYDVTGREVVTLVDAQLEAGYYTAEFNGTNLASGVYFYRIIAEGEGQKFTKTLKMVLVK